MIVNMVTQKLKLLVLFSIKSKRFFLAIRPFAFIIFALCDNILLKIIGYLKKYCKKYIMML